MQIADPSTTSTWTGPRFWENVRRDVASAFGMSPAVYADEDFFAAEQRRLFGRAWVGVALAWELARPGRLLVRSVGGRSILLTRSGDRIRGFLNSCRHRGTELAEADRDVGATIRCPYHRWSYGTDGRLVAAPLFDTVPRDDFDRADWGLIPVRTESWGPVVFACLDERTPPLATWLGDLPTRMAGGGVARRRGADARSRPQRESRACTAWMSSGQSLLMKASTAQISPSTSLSAKPGMLLG